MLRDQTTDLTQIEDPSFVCISCIIILNCFTPKFTSVSDVFVLVTEGVTWINWHFLLYSELDGQIYGPGSVV